MSSGRVAGTVAILLLSWASRSGEGRVEPVPEGDLPPLKDSSPFKGLMQTELAAEFASCSTDGVRRGEYGDVFVRVDDLKDVNVSSSPRVGANTRRCVESLVRRLVQAESRQPTGRISSLNYRDDLPIGAPRPLLGDTAGMLRVWTQFLERPTPENASLLKRRLPPELELSGKGCLQIAAQSYGTNVVRSLQLSLEPMKSSRVRAFWLDALDLNRQGGRSEIFHAVFLVGQDRLLKVSDDKIERVLLCQDSISPSRSSALLAQVESVGSCFAGDLATILTNPRYEFPRSTVARSVSTNGSVSCATTDAGKIKCCGRAGEVISDVPAAPVRQVEVIENLAHQDAACAVTMSGAVQCWGAVPEEPAGRKAVERVCSDGVCAIGKGRSLEFLWSTTASTPASIQHKVADAAALIGGQACAVLTDGALGCWDPFGGRKVGKGRSADWTRIPGRWSSVAMGPGAVCATAVDRTDCWDQRTTTGRPLVSRSALASIVVTSKGALCGVNGSGEVEYEAIGPHAELPSPAPRGVLFSGLTEGAGLLCGVATDGRVHCWGRAWPRLDADQPLARPDASGGH